MAKQKRMTQKEKQLRADTKKRLQAQGLLPPDKKPLNRRKFAEETMAAFESRRPNVVCLYEAIGWMMPSTIVKRPITPEQVGVLKVLRLAVELERFYDKLSEEGREKYTVAEIGAVVMPIIEL